MSDDTDRETRPAGRNVNVHVFGDTADEIEMAALDEVRPFFGEDVRLEVVRDYKAWRISELTWLAAEDAEAVKAQANGKQWEADVTVRTIEP
jgi:hypothetical protein